MKINKLFIASLAVLALGFGLIACDSPSEKEEYVEEDTTIVTPEEDGVVDEDVDIDMDTEVEEEGELEDLEEPIEDPELEDPNATFDENLEVDPQLEEGE